MADTPMVRQLSGRTPIYTDAVEITATNVCDVLSRALAVHMDNRADIEYLYNYYKGLTPVRYKEKEVRENINWKINQAIAYQVTEFKNSVCFGEPVQYVCRGDAGIQDIDDLNDYMVATEKEVADSNLGKWMHIAGVGYRMALPNAAPSEDDAPFEHYVLDPRLNFVVKGSDFRHRPLMSVTIVPQGVGPDLHCVYTADAYFEIEGVSNVRKVEANPLGMIPVVEYPLNPAMLGAYEPALPLLDAINALESNRLDDVEQFVNSFLVLMSAGMEEEQYKKLADWKMLCLPEGADAKYLSAALQQADIQTLKDDLYQAVITVLGMPSQSGESTSTSDTGKAAVYRGGWNQATARAKDTQTEFQRSERQFLRVVLRIMRDTVGTSLRVPDIDIKFTVRFVEDLATKVQSLQGLLNAGVHPEIAIATCSIWNDPTDVYLKSKEYLKQWEIDADESTENVREGGSDEPDAGEADESVVRPAS